jgi:hypothetical protein
MRPAARALIGVMFVVCCREAAAADSASSWWPFGHKDEAAVSQPPGGAATAAPAVKAPVVGSGLVAHQVELPQSPPDSNEHWMLNTQKKKVSWPKLHMPELSKPHVPGAVASAKKPTTEPSHNSWAQAPAAPKPGPLQSVKDGANRVTAGTKSAWHKTVAAVTPGDKSKKETSARVAKRDPQPSLWKRMMGPKQPEVQPPQTVPQWMAQKRLDP